MPKRASSVVRVGPDDEPEQQEEDQDATARALAESRRRSQAMVDAWRDSQIQGRRQKPPP